MKQIEYIYLLLMIGGIIFLATEFKDMSNTARILGIVGVGIMAFMYSFRRYSRISMEKRWEEEEGNEDQQSD